MTVECLHLQTMSDDGSKEEELNVSVKPELRIPIIHTISY